MPIAHHIITCPPPQFSDLPEAMQLWSMVLLSNMANQVKNPFKCHNYTIYVKKNGFCIDDFVEFCRINNLCKEKLGETSTKIFMTTVTTN